MSQRQRETFATRQGTLHYKKTQTDPGTHGIKGGDKKEKKNTVATGKGEMGFQ